VVFRHDRSKLYAGRVRKIFEPSRLKNMPPDKHRSIQSNRTAADGGAGTNVANVNSARFCTCWDAPIRARRIVRPIAPPNVRIIIVKRIIIEYRHCWSGGRGLCDGRTAQQSPVSWCIKQLPRIGTEGGRA